MIEMGKESCRLVVEGYCLSDGLLKPLIVHDCGVD